MLLLSSFSKSPQKFHGKKTKTPPSFYKG